MQAPKTRTASSEVAQRTSPATPRTARQLKIPGSDSDSVPSPHPASRTPKDRSPKVIERRSPRSPASERKRPGRVSDLESQLAHLQEDLKNAKDQLNSSESCKRQAQQEAEEAQKQLAAKLEDSKLQLLELSASGEARVQELRNISEDRDQARIDARNLRLQLTETLTLVEKLKTQLGNCKESEARASEIVREAQIELEIARITEDTLRSEGLKAMEACNSLVVELEQSKGRVNSLERLVSKLQTDLRNYSRTSSVKIEPENGEYEESTQLKTSLNNLKFEVDQLRSALEAAERRYQEEYIHSTLQIRSAYELVERTKSESCHREAELVAELKMAKSDVEALKAKLIEKETELHSMSEEKNESNERISELEMGIKRSEVDLAELKSILLHKEAALQSITEENETMKLEMKKREMERSEVKEEALALAEAARAGEREALMKLGYLTEESDKSSRKAARVGEQLDAAQVAISEMEAELRRLKVQSDQWRKAAETAAAMLSGGNNGKFVERTGSLDNNYHTIGGKLSSAYYDDMDDYSPKKKNGNMLKRIGVLLKKGSQK